MIATAAEQKFNRGGVLYEGCEPNCTGDGQALKGMFIRDLRAPGTATGSTQFDRFITTTANSILANDTDTDSAGRQGDSFVGPFAQWTCSTQAVAADDLVAALNTTSTPDNSARPGVGPVCRRTRAQPGEPDPSRAAGLHRRSQPELEPHSCGTAHGLRQQMPRHEWRRHRRRNSGRNLQLQGLRQPAVDTVSTKQGFAR